jgi:hypothetical protein
MGKPSRYRFLVELYPSGGAALIALLLHEIAKIPCTMPLWTLRVDECGIEFPSYLWCGIAVVFCCGIAGAAYRFYRDFYKGDYYVDRGDC